MHSKTVFCLTRLGGFSHSWGMQALSPHKNFLGTSFFGFSFGRRKRKQGSAPLFFPTAIVEGAELSFVYEEDDKHTPNLPSKSRIKNQITHFCNLAFSFCLGFHEDLSKLLNQGPSLMSQFVCLLILLTSFTLTACRDEGRVSKSPCDGRQWTSSKEELDCRFPPPPIGRWHAVYTKDFAKEHNLPLENVSTDLSPGVDYMEMDVQPYGKGGVGCLVNMLVKKPHDIALYSGHVPPIAANRKLTHLIELDHLKDNLKGAGSFWSASRDYNIPAKKGYAGSTFAFYAEDALPGYDYISANKNCRDVSMHPDYFPNGYAFWIGKASVWGMYEMRHRNYDSPGTPKGKDFYYAHFFINIPYELVEQIFKDVPIGGQ